MVNLRINCQCRAGLGMTRLSRHCSDTDVRVGEQDTDKGVAKHMFDVSVDQFIHADGGARSSSCRKHIDVLLNSMNEKELVVIEATAEGIKKARETEVPE